MHKLIIIIYKKNIKPSIKVVIHYIKLKVTIYYINIKPSIKVVIDYINININNRRRRKREKRERGSLSHLFGVKKMGRGVWYL